MAAIDIKRLEAKKKELQTQIAQEEAVIQRFQAQAQSLQQGINQHLTALVQMQGGLSVMEELINGNKEEKEDAKPKKKPESETSQAS